MIWLSPTNGTEECSIYFEIRDIDLQWRENRTSGVVRGLLGDGLREFIGEVFLGTEESAQILPVWTDNGEVETFSAAVDESLLLRQMVTEVKTLLPIMENVRNERRSLSWQRPDNATYCSADNLAA